jgi:hypothetical protein
VHLDFGANFHVCACHNYRELGFEDFEQPLENFLEGILNISFIFVLLHSRDLIVSSFLFSFPALFFSVQEGRGAAETRAEAQGHQQQQRGMFMTASLTKHMFV